jgi:hypothetical protein
MKCTNPIHGKAGYKWNYKGNLAKPICPSCGSRVKREV